MSIERFTKQEFEEALPSVLNWKCNGLVSGEYEYETTVEHAKIVVRSSVGRDGVAADTGKNSIRMYVRIGTEAGGYVGGKRVDSYTTRVPGWQERMVSKLRELYRMARRVKRTAPVCACGKQKWAAFSKKDRRPFAKCNLCDSFEWLDKPKPSQEKETVETNDLMDQIGQMLGEPEAEEKVASAPIGPNAEQKAVIESPTDESARVLAGPGSGKTFTMLRRYEELIKRGVRPDNILAVAFNKKMADSLLERALKSMPQLRGTSAEQQICTIHAFCYRQLRQRNRRWEKPFDWKIRNEVQDISAMIWRNAELRPKDDELMAAADNAMHRGYQPGGDAMDLWMQLCDETPVMPDELDGFYRRYMEMMQDRNWLTFNGMLYHMERALMEDKSFLADMRQRFEFVIIDEGQDVNAQALNILTMIASGPNNKLLIVGDSDQMLYRFAGAKPEILMFELPERIEGIKTYKLNTNYRSTKEVVGKSKRLIGNNYGPDAYPVELKKEMVARHDAEDGEPITFQMYENPEEEASAVVNEIQTKIQTGEAKADDIFISARTRAQLLHIESELLRKGIPFINLAGGSFWLATHIRKLVDYLRLDVDSSDQMAFESIYRVASAEHVHPWGKAKGTYSHNRYLGKAFLRSYPSPDHLHEALNERRFAQGALDLMETMKGVGEQEGHVAKLRWLVENVIRQWVIAEYGGANMDYSEGKLEDLWVVVDVAANHGSAEAFLEFVDQAIEQARKKQDKDWSDHVVISTIHRLKGQERPVMFGIGWCEGVDPSTGLETGLLPHTFSLRASPNFGILNFSTKGSIEDERCLAFVAISRAERTVHLSGVRRYRGAHMRPSRFAVELGLVQ